MSENTPNRYWFIFHKSKLLLVKNASGTRSVPYAATAPVQAEGLAHELGEFGGAPCTACATAFMPDDPSYEAVDLRASYTEIGKELYAWAGKGCQMLYWDENSRFCSFCGGPNTMDSPISKVCQACGKLTFTSLSTAVLVLVHKEDSVLLVRAHNFRGPFYGCVAGFVEPGESLEECVRREVREETSLDVDTIRYFGSQPWPYPNNLMVAFTARYKAGEVTLQENELASGAFFPRGGLPELPPPLSLARRMIDAWVGA